MVGPGIGSARSKSAASSRWQKYGERKSSGRQTTPRATGGGLADARDGPVEVGRGVGPQRIWTRPIEKRVGAAIGGDSAHRVASCQRERRPDPRSAGIAGAGRSRMPGMDMSYTPEEEAFRARVRAWLEENVPAPGSLAEDLDAMRAWQRKLHAAGLLAVSWPKEYGGAGLSPMEQAILNEELARVRAPGVVNAMAIWWVGPAIMKYGTDDAEAALHPEDPERRGDLGDRILRAVVGLGHGGGEDARRAPGRLLRRQRPEDLDHAGAHLRLVLRAGADLERVRSGAGCRSS